MSGAVFDCAVVLSNSSQPSVCNFPDQSTSLGRDSKLIASEGVTTDPYEKLANRNTDDVSMRALALHKFMPMHISGDVVTAVRHQRALLELTTAISRSLAAVAVCVTVPPSSTRLSSTAFALMALAQFGWRSPSLVRCAIVLKGSARTFATQLRSGDSASSPGDAFAAQLQAKTERELLELLERRDRQSEQQSAQQPAQHNATNSPAGKEQASQIRTRQLHVGMTTHEADVSGPG